MSNTDALSLAAEQLRNATRAVVFTGAGISAESGIPTFRDRLTGLWQHYDQEQLATRAAFRRDPALVWSWYQWRRALIAQAQPNAAHHALVALADRVPQLTVVTQNIDDLHERAGSQDVIHLHGRIDQPRCFACARPHDSFEPPSLSSLESLQEPPRCIRCGGRVRPGVVWFGEALPKDELRRAFRAVKECDVLISIGNSGAVYPAAALPHVAMLSGADVIHINPEALEHDRDICLQGLAGEWLPRLVEYAFAIG